MKNREFLCVCERHKLKNVPCYNFLIFFISFHRMCVALKSILSQVLGSFRLCGGKVRIFF